MLEQVARLLALPDTPRYNIKAVVQQTQVNVSTLRAWEQRYGVPHPKRSDHGHRLYSQRDIEIITWLRQCTEEGLTISQAVMMLHDLNRKHEVVHTEPQAATRVDFGWPAIQQQLIDALLNADLRQAHLLVNTLITVHPVETLVVQVFEPVMAAVGDRWASGRLCVADERFVSNFVRQRLSALMQNHAPFANGQRLICACAPGEMHELGLMMFALLMEQRGWEIVYLGQGVVTDGLGDFLQRMAPALLCVSVTMTEHVVGMLEIAQVITSQIGRAQIELAYGGQAFTWHPDLIHHLPGTYLSGSLLQATAQADALGSRLGQERMPHVTNAPVRPSFVPAARSVA